MNKSFSGPSNHPGEKDSRCWHKGISKKTLQPDHHTVNSKVPKPCSCYQRFQKAFQYPILSTNKKTEITRHLGNASNTTDGDQKEGKGQLGRCAWARHGEYAWCLFLSALREPDGTLTGMRILAGAILLKITDRSGPSLCDYRAIKNHCGIFTIPCFKLTHITKENQGKFLLWKDLSFKYHQHWERQTYYIKNIFCK